MPDIVAVGIAALVAADTGVSVVVDIAEFDIAAVAGIAALVEAGTAALVVLIAYPSSSQFRLPSNHLSTHLHPCQTHSLPWGIMESLVFACIPLPKTVLFYTW